MQTLDRRKYVLYYPPEFAGGERAQIINGFDWFTEEKGFRQMEIDEIESMDDMDTVNISYLKVWRIN